MVLRHRSRPAAVSSIYIWIGRRRQSFSASSAGQDTYIPSCNRIAAAAVVVVVVVVAVVVLFWSP
jgi:hypothetical protein